MSMVKKQWEFLKDIALLIEKAEELNITLTAGEAYRSEYQQKEYVRAGKSKTMDSQHLKRLAMDFNFFINGKLTYEKEDIQPLGDFWESLRTENSWGGNWESFKDTPHFERRG